MVTNRCHQGYIKRYIIYTHPAGAIRIYQQLIKHYLIHSPKRGLVYTYLYINSQLNTTLYTHPKGGWYIHIYILTAN